MHDLHRATQVSLLAALYFLPVTPGVVAGGVTLTQAPHSEPAQPAPPGGVQPSLPPGVETRRLLPRGDGDGRATLALAEALARISPNDFLPARRSLQTPTDQVLRETTRLYLQAREMTIEGRYFDSIRTLEQALKLDPTAVACMRLMAENYLSTIGPAKALKLYEDILSIDPDDVDALLRLGSAAWQRRDAARAAAMLGRACTLLSDPQTRPSDGDVWALAAYDLGQVLLAEGYDEAGVSLWNELVQRLAAVPPQSPRYQREIDRLHRAAPEMWRDLGDAFCRLERFDDAVEVYALALHNARSTGESTLPRLLWALLRSGREQDALSVFLQAIEDPAMPEAVELASLFRGTPSSDALAGALRRRLEEHPGELAYVQALATLLPPERSDAIILEFLGRFGTDPDVIRGLLPWAIERLAPSQPVRLIIAVAEKSGRVPDELLDELVALTDDPDRYAAAVRDLPQDVARGSAAELIRIGLLLRGARLAEAREALDALVAARPALAEAQLVRARLLLALNLEDAAAEVLEAATLGPGDPLALFYNKALLLADAGRIDAALALFDHVAQERADEIDRVEHLRRRAMLLADAGRAREAAEVLNEALKIDPGHDAVHGALLRLHGFGGPLRNTERVDELVRSLMASAPQGRTIRLLRAEQDVVRGRFDDAIAAYQALLADDPNDEAALEALRRTWLAANRAAEAAEWFEARRQNRPGDRPLRDAWLTSLVADQRANLAIDFLRRTIVQRPDDFDSYRRLEEVLRSVGREEESRAVMQDRWSRMPPSVARSLALAELEMQAERSIEAVAHLRDALARAGEHLIHHIEPIMAMASRMADSGARDEALQLMESACAQVVEKDLAAPPPVFLAWITAMAELDRPLDAIVAAIGRVRAIRPEIELEMTALATVTLARRERIDDACTLADAWLGAERVLQASDAGLIEWRLMQSILRNEPQHAINLTRRAFADEAHRAMRIFSSRPVLDRRASDPLANALYLLSLEFSANDFHSSHERLLEEALAVDPDHAAANNDLGYTLADRNERLDEAERMLVKAVKADPSNSAYLDSLGWVRYKLGRLEDAGDEVHEYGAIRLLEEAALLRRGQARLALDDDPVILDHLGDAYWRARRAADAVNSWKRAVSAYDEQLKMTVEAAETDNETFSIDLFRKHYEPVAEAARAKVKAAENGEPPPVSPAPALDEPNR